MVFLEPPRTSATRNSLEMKKRFHLSRTYMDIGIMGGKRWIREWLGIKKMEKR
jgi:hypothetical protein